jgi:hypothetical protein
MKDKQELIPFIIFFVVCVFLIRNRYIREKKYKYSKTSDYAFINSIKTFGILITTAIVCLIKIIFEILKLID